MTDASEAVVQLSRGNTLADKAERFLAELRGRMVVEWLLRLPRDQQSACNRLIRMVGRVGIEPTTKRLRVSCSTS